MSSTLSRMDFDVTRQLRTIEWLKSELVSGVAAIFKAMLKSTEETAADALANLVMTSYLLGKRLGISFASLDEKVMARVAVNIHRGHEMEKWYGDFSALRTYLEGCRGKHVKPGEGGE